MNYGKYLFIFPSNRKPIDETFDDKKIIFANAEYALHWRRSSVSDVGPVVFGQECNFFVDPLKRDSAKSDLVEREPFPKTLRGEPAPLSQRLKSFRSCAYFGAS